MGTGRGSNDPVYHYHSNYDSYHWMATFGDPGFHTHVAMGQYLTLLAYHMATDQVIPFDVNNYVTEMNEYLEELKKTITESGKTLDVSKIESAIATFQTAATAATEMIEQAKESGDAELVDLVNAKLRDFERAFVDQGGLPTREFYKHVIFAPGLDTGYAPVTFPGVTEAVVAGDLDVAAEWVDKSSAGILAAAEILKP
jgi:N-acetylated-alpha-linked acidic dipeptidase